MLYVVYLDEFGHDGPFISRQHPKYNESPIFGLGGFALPYTEVRSFASWFFSLKKNLLAWEIDRSGEHPAKWEKKGASLYTTKNVQTYYELRQATNRILNKMKNSGGFCFYFGVEKYNATNGHDAKALYKVTLGKAMRRIDEEFANLGGHALIILDQHQQRNSLVEYASKTMFGENPARSLIEPPVQVESHLYQTLQCADWLCGLLGRLHAHRVRPIEFKEFAWAETYFGGRIDAVARRSAIQKKRRDARGVRDTAMKLAFEKAREGMEPGR